MTIKKPVLKKALMAVPAAGLVLIVLYPVFANPFVRSRESARKTQCINNLKQIGTAMNMYYTDYDGMLPSSVVRTQSKKWDADAFIAFAMYKNAPNGRATMFQVLSPFMKTKDIMWCPSDTENSSRPTARVSYYYKAAIDRSWFDGKGREGHMHAPEDQIEFWENSSRHWENGARGLTNGASINVVYFDGHVATRRIRNSGYTAEENPATPLPKSKMGEPAWFNAKIEGDRAAATRNYYDTTKYMDVLD